MVKKRSPAIGKGPLLRVIVMAVIVGAIDSTGAELRSCFRKNSSDASLRNVWVIFADKSSVGPAPLFLPRTLSRRAKVRFPAVSQTDLPVSQRYIREVERLGGRCRNVFAWANAASFSIRPSALAALSQQRFVKDILPLRTFSEPVVQKKNQPPLQKSSAIDSSAYGASILQMGMPNIPIAHDRIVHTLQSTPGNGVVIGLFDSGFLLSHRCFDYIISHQAIIADSNFVDHTGMVNDSVSIREAYLNAGLSPPEEHGSWVLSLIAGYDPGKFMGAAWGARFVLARTEWVGRIINGAIRDVEVHGEEDNWAAALVWAESRGVDIVSSSLAYRTDFTDSFGNAIDSSDYRYSDLDGETTIISRAALEATKRGMIIVNSIGNDGAARGTVNAPADVEDVVSVGGVSMDKSIWSLSSRGPTADGRIKPDVVTLASWMYLPQVYSPDSASYDFGEAGTSFAAPVVAGICALIRQTHPADAAPSIRRRLYASCNFAPAQDSIDNDFGRGIPNAFVACFHDTAAVQSDESIFRLYPTTIRIVSKKQRLTLEFMYAPDDPLHHSQQLTISIRTVNGAEVWRHAEYMAPNPPPLYWPESQNYKMYAPGMYYCIVTYAGKTLIKKFIILG